MYVYYKQTFQNDIIIIAFKSLQRFSNNSQIMNELFDIIQLESNNRGVIAKKDIEKNQQILESEPIASATLQSAKTKYCNWCFLQKQLVKCSQCKCFYYCSIQCQKSDWKYHKLECKMYSKMSTQKNLSIHKQIATQFVLNVRLYIVLQLNKQLSQQFYSMCSLQEYQPLERRQHFQELSLVMMENLGLEKNESNMSQLMKQLNIVSVNAFTVQDLFYTSEGVAVAVYWPANHLNHACNANSTQVFDGRYLKIITNQNVAKGDQLTICYTNPLELQKDRSRFLKENYLFDCFCELCQVQKMINTQYAYIKCPECKQSAIRKKRNIKLPQDENQDQNGPQIIQQKQRQSQNQHTPTYQCTQCQKPIDLKFLKQMALKIQQLSAKIQSLKSYKEKKKQLLAMKNEFDLKHPSFYRALESVYLSAIDEGLLSDDNEIMKKYFNEGNILLNEILKNLTQWYKIEEEDLINIKFFSKFNEMSKLAYNMSKLTKCLENLEKAIRCVQKLKLRNKYKEIDELKKRYDQVKIQMSIAKSKAIQ